MNKKVICLTNKNGAMKIMSVDKFLNYVKHTPGVTLKDGALYVEHDELFRITTVNLEMLLSKI